MSMPLDLRELGRMGYSQFQHRASSATDSTSDDDSKGNAFIFTKAKWAIPTGAEIVPFPFKVIGIGPNSHIGTVCVKPPGQVTRLLTVDAPLIGSFDSNTQVFPFRSMNSFTDPGYLELIYYLNGASGEIGKHRAPFVRVVLTGVLQYPGGIINDPDFIVTSPSRTILDGRNKLSVMIHGATSSYHVRWYYGVPYDWAQPSALISAFAIQQDDANVFLADNVIQLDVPVGVTSMALIDNATGVEVVGAPSLYITAED